MSANLHKALALYNQGLFEDAELLLRESLDKKPLDHNACHLGAMISNKLGKLTNALSYAEAALRIDTNNHEIWNTQGNIQSNMGLEDAAVSSLKKSLALYPDYTAAQQNLAFLFNKLQAPVSALKLFEKLTQKNPTKASYIIGKAQALIMAERAPEALNYLKNKSINLPIDLALYTQAQALFADGQYERALEAYNAIPAHSNLYVEAKKNYFQILHLTGHDNEISDILNSEDSYTERDEIISLNIEMVRKIHGLDTAKTYSSKKVPEHHNSPFILSALTDIDIANKAYSDAFIKTTQALKLMPNYIPFLAKNVTAALGIGEYSHARGIINQQVLQTPNNQYWLAMSASLQRLMGENHNYLYNYSDFVKTFDIPVPNGYSTQGSYLTALKATLVALHEYEVEPLDQSLRRGTQTRANLVHLDIPALRSFFSSINICLQEYVKDLPIDLEHPFLKRTTAQPRIISAWSVKLMGNGFHVNHVHPEGWISSAFYVEVPDGIEQDQERKGWIKFGEPSFDISGLDAEHFIAPTAGKLVLFPSYLWHGTVPTTERAFRLTLPFDVLPV